MPRHVCQKLAENLTVNQGLMMLGVGKFRVRLMTEAQYDDYLNGTDAVFETVIVDDRHQEKERPISR